MGRIREFKNRIGITAYLEGDEFQALEEIRWRDHKDLTEVVRLAVRDYIRAHANGNDTFRLDTWQENPNFHAVPTIYADNQKWLNHFKDCKVSERAELLKKLNILRKLAAVSGPLK